MPAKTRTCRLACLSSWLIALEASGAAALPAGMPIEEAVALLEAEGLRVFYSTDLVKPWMRIRVEPSSDDPARALEEILAPLGLETRQGPGGSWLIVRAAPVSPPVPSAPGAAAGAPVPRQRPARLPLEEMVVSASQYELQRTPGASRQRLEQADLEHLPDLGDDAVRAVARLPGTASNGIAARSNIRGGEIDETLVRLDGLRLYDPFHLSDFQGIFSALDPRVIRSMDVYTGGFPVTYGDRMSGVIDIHSIDAPADLYHEVGVSFFNSSVLSTGRFGDGAGEWVASARRSNLELLYETFSDRLDRPNYTDRFAKLSYELGDRLTITGNVLELRDDIEVSDDVDREETATAIQRDVYRWLRLDHAPANGFEGSTLLAHTRLGNERVGTSAKEGISRGSLSDVRSFEIDSVQTEWTRRAGARMLLRFGAEAARLEGAYDYDDEVELELLFDVDVDGDGDGDGDGDVDADVDGEPGTPRRSRSISARPDGRRHAVFAAAKYNATPRLTAELGLRWDEQRLDAAHSSTLSPRFGLRYGLTGATSLRASWGRFFQSQGINELQVSDGVDTFFEPQRTDHVIVGVEHVFPRGISLRAEAYDKSATSLQPRFENLLNALVLLPELKPDRIRIAPDSARARGVEVLVDGEAADSIRWWLGYSWSRATDRIAGTDVPRSWDQTHALTAGLDFDTPRWNAGFAVLYRSGWPTTAAALQDGEGGAGEGGRAAGDGMVPVVTTAGRNSALVGSYGSLDLRVTRKFELERSSLWVSLEVVNGFDRDNPCCIEYELGSGDEGERDGTSDQGQLVLERLNYVPRIPSVGVLWKF